ncbi:MAG: hypothetical protein ACLFPX_04490 [Candidatus Omnitrophota bacterium]
MRSILFFIVAGSFLVWSGAGSAQIFPGPGKEVQEVKLVTGDVVSLNSALSTIVIRDETKPEKDIYQRLTCYVNAETEIRYEGQSLELTDLSVGDRVRVDCVDYTYDATLARRIEVLSKFSD